MRKLLLITLQFRLIVPFIILIFTLASCEKEVHINLGTSPSQIVVQGAIETDLPPYVVLTSTIGFFSDIDLSTLEKSFVHGAIIKVSDGSKTITLKEYAIDTGKNNKFYIYTVDTSNLSNIMLGQVNKFYTLTIIKGDKTYTSITKIPNPKGPDSLWFDIPVFQNSKTPDSARQLFANYSDPDTPGNCVRYFTSRDGGPFFSSGLFSDEAVNGKTIRNISLFAGYDNGINANGDSLRYFYPGSEVTLKWSEVDVHVYNFWNSLNYASSAIGNPFATPINLQTNITGGGLGIWAGYGNVIVKMVVPH